MFKTVCVLEYFSFLPRVREWETDANLTVVDALCGRPESIV